MFDEYIIARNDKKLFMPVLAINKKARFDYELLEDFSAGLVLSGAEVKSAKAGQVSLKGAFVVLKQAKIPEAWLLNAYINPYKFAGQFNEKPDRSRKLLLNKKELLRLESKIQDKGLTLVPTKIYTNNGLVKVDFSLARGKKKHDKRDDIKKKDVERDLRRLVKR